MAKSMTGFGRYEEVTQSYKMTVEIKSVNHRYFDLSVKMPRKFHMLEQQIRNIIKQSVSRGKVDVYISYEDYEEAALTVRYHPHIVSGYVESIRSIAKEFCVETGSLDATFLARLPEVLVIEEGTADTDHIQNLMIKGVQNALASFVETRLMEGQELVKDILLKLDKIEEHVDYVESRSPQIIEAYRKKITEKVAELLGDRKIDEGILATELTIYADKTCVDEETVRLRSHIHHMKDTLQQEEAMGRKLDFITQEMNREANTILSKSNDRELSEKAIALKTEIEKIREQIQNIE